MAVLQYTIQDYSAYVNMSNRKKLLVEGPDDKRFFDFLRGHKKNWFDSLDIDDACIIASPHERLGNREKIERVNVLIEKTSFSDKFLGLVDREFRGFDLEDRIVDTINSHYIDGRLIWTMGHSIENYFLDYDLLNYTISTLSTSPYCRNAMIVFKDIFPSILQLSCAVSLACFEINNFAFLYQFLSWEIFNLDETRIEINYQTLEEELRNQNVPEEWISSLLTRIPFWYQQVIDSEPLNPKWLNHGHLSLSIMWASFQKCISVCCNSNYISTEISHTLQANANVKFNTCAQKYLSTIDLDNNAFPKCLFQQLNVVS